MSQLPTKKVEERLKAKMDLDKAKIESLEAELTHMHMVAKQYEEALAQRIRPW